MFTGIVTDIGEIGTVEPKADGLRRIVILCNYDRDGIAIGASIACSGVCLTVVETGLNETELGKVILAACFVTDLGTVVALGACFGHYDRTLLVFAAVLLVVLPLTPRVVGGFFAASGNRCADGRLNAPIPATYTPSFTGTGAAMKWSVDLTCQRIAGAAGPACPSVLPVR